MKYLRIISVVTASVGALAGKVGCSAGLGGGFTVGSPGAVSGAIPTPPRLKVHSLIPGVPPKLLNMPIRVREGVDVVFPGDLPLSGYSQIVKLGGTLELAPGMLLVDIERAVAALGSTLVLDPLLSTPEFQAFVIEGKFGTQPRTIYYFERGVYLGSWTPPPTGASGP